VVDQVELLARCKRACGSIDFAGELAVCRIEFIFPELIGQSVDVKRKKTIGREREIWIGRTILNWGRMKLTTGSSAPLSMKTTTRLPDSIISPSVGQSSRDITGRGGTYAICVKPSMNKSTSN